MEKSLTDLFDQIADEYAQAIRSGEQPGIDGYIARYPELEDKIARLFPVLRMMELNGRSLDQLSESNLLAEELKQLQTLPPQKQLGDYRIIREIGRGGMGIVYEAEQESLGRKVALKVLPNVAQFDDRRQQRFQQEARASAMLHHSNIVTVFGVGQHNEMSYIVMQLIEGASLDEVIAELQKTQRPLDLPIDKSLQETDRPDATNATIVAAKISSLAIDTPYVGPVAETPAEPNRVSTPGSLPDRTLASGSSSLSNGWEYFRNVARVGIQVGSALAYAHKNGILHRDIKPGNLILDDRCNVWVTDFGLAKSINEQDLTRTGETVGTLRYLPPEQFDGKSDARSDVYSLGLTLYELLTLRPAFNDREYAQLMRSVTESEPPALRKINPRIPRDLETIVLKAIAKSPDQRYGSAQLLVDDLTLFQEGKPILAKQISEWDRLVKAVKRRPIVSTLSLLLLLALVAGSGLVTWQWREANSALQTAKVEAETREEMLDFFIFDLLRKASPKLQPDPDIKLRTVLDRAGQLLDSKFQNRPLVEAELRSHIGMTLLDLGEINQAYKHVSRAVELREEFLSQDDKLVWLSYMDLAAIESQLGHHREALQILENVLENTRRLYGDDDYEATPILADIATVMIALGRFNEAESILDEVVISAKAEHDNSHEHVLLSKLKLADVYFNQGKFEKARALAASIEPVLSQNGQNTYAINALNVQAMCLDSMKKPEEAEAIFRKVLGASEEMLGEGHYETLTIVHNYIICLMNQRRLDEAEKMLTKQIRLLKKEVGDDHEDTLGAQSNLASIHQLRGEYDPAKELFLAIRVQLLKKFGENHPDTIANTNNLAVLYLQTGRYEESLQMYESAVLAGEAAWGEEHPNTIVTIAGLGKIQAKLKRFDEAEKNYLRSLALSRKVMGPDHPDTIITQEEIASLYRRLGKFDRAAEVLFDVLTAIEDQHGPNADKTLNTRIKIGYCLTKLEKFAEAKTQYEKVYDSRRKAKGLLDPETVTPFLALTDVEDSLDQHEIVEDRMKAFIGAMEQEPEENWWLFKAKSRLGRALTKLGRFDDAEKELLASFEGFQEYQGKDLGEARRESELRSTAMRLVELYEGQDLESKTTTWKNTYDSLKNGD